MGMGSKRRACQVLQAAASGLLGALSSPRPGRQGSQLAPALRPGGGQRGSSQPLAPEVTLQIPQGWPGWEGPHLPAPQPSPLSSMGPAPSAAGAQPPQEQGPSPQHSLCHSVMEIMSRAAWGTLQGEAGQGQGALGTEPGHAQGKLTLGKL